MRKTVVVRYKTDKAGADENERLVRRVFDELSEKNPEGLRYATLRLDDGVTFVHIAVVDGEQNPLTSLPAFSEFQAGLGDRCVEPPSPAEATVIGSYRLLNG